MGDGRGKWEANKWLTVLMQGLIKQDWTHCLLLKMDDGSNKGVVWGLALSLRKAMTQLRISSASIQKASFSLSRSLWTTVSLPWQLHWRLWQLEQTTPCGYPHPVIHPWAQHRPQAARSSSMACSVDNKTACFQHTNVIPASEYFSLSWTTGSWNFRA